MSDNSRENCRCCLSEAWCPCEVEHVTETNEAFFWCREHERECNGQLPKLGQLESILNFVRGAE